MIKMIVELFYPPNQAIETSMTAIKILAMTDLSITVIIVFMQYCLWTNIPVFYALLSLFQALHMFTWMGGITLTSPIYHTGYVIMVLVLYMLSFIPDVATAIWRVVILDPSAQNAPFVYTAAVLNVILVVVDSGMVLAVGDLLPRAVNYTDDIKLALSNSEDNQKKLEVYKKVPEELHKCRARLMSVAMAEVFLVAVVAAIDFVGLNISTTFASLAGAQIPHVFLWIASFGVAKGVNDTARIYLLMVMYLVAFFLDVGSLIWMILIIVNCYAFGSWSSCIWVSFASWISCACVLGLALCAIINSLYLWTIQDEIGREYSRLRPIVKRTINVFG
jgi:hypothetical protein